MDVQQGYTHLPRPLNQDGGTEQFFVGCHVHMTQSTAHKHVNDQFVLAAMSVNVYSSLKYRLNFHHIGVMDLNPYNTRPLADH
jgi:hypothetical protein